MKLGVGESVWGGVRPVRELTVRVALVLLAVAVALGMGPVGVHGAYGAGAPSDDARYDLSNWKGTCTYHYGDCTTYITLDDLNVSVCRYDAATDAVEYLARENFEFVAWYSYEEKIEDYRLWGTNPNRGPRSQGWYQVEYRGVGEYHGTCRADVAIIDCRNLENWNSSSYNEVVGDGSTPVAYQDLSIVLYWCDDETGETTYLDASDFQFSGWYVFDWEADDYRCIGVRASQGPSEPGEYSVKVRGTGSYYGSHFYDFTIVTAGEGDGEDGEDARPGAEDGNGNRLDESAAPGTEGDGEATGNEPAVTPGGDPVEGEPSDAPAAEDPKDDAAEDGSLQGDGSQGDGPESGDPEGGAPEDGASEGDIPADGGLADGGLGGAPSEGSEGLWGPEVSGNPEGTENGGAATVSPGTQTGEAVGGVGASGGVSGTEAPAALKVGATFTVGKATYRVTSAKRRTVALTGSTARKVAVPATVKAGGVTYKVTALTAKVLKGAVATKVTLGKNVLTIGKQALRGAKKLTSLTIGAGVTTVRAGALKGCTRLKTVTIKSGHLTKASLRRLVKGSAVTTIKLKGAAAKKMKARYQTWLGAGYMVKS